VHAAEQEQADRDPSSGLAALPGWVVSAKQVDAATQSAWSFGSDRPSQPSVPFGFGASEQLPVVTEVTP